MAIYLSTTPAGDFIPPQETIEVLAPTAAGLIVEKVVDADDVEKKIAAHIVI